MTINAKQIAFNRSTRTDKIKYIVIHDTGNKSAGANAEAHFNYFNGGDRQSSADFFVDSKQILQANDYSKYYTWHCGDGGGKYGITNNNSIGIEICVNSDGNYDAAFNKTVKLVKMLMDVLNIPIERVVRHYDASRKNCPASMSGNNWALWHTFKGQLIFNHSGETTEMAGGEKMIYNYIDENTAKIADDANECLQHLVDKGFLRGNEKGELNLTLEMIRIFLIHYRAGLYN